MSRAAPPRPRYDMRRDGAASALPGGPAGDIADRLRAAALEPPRVASPFGFWGRALLWIVLVYAGWSYISLPIVRSQMLESWFAYVLAMANLVFHEAGHIILMPLGRFLSTLGGSLFQVLIPTCCLGAFLRQRDAYAAAVMLWWTGQNLIELAPYINDASAQRLVLLGGVTGRDAPGYHDWNNLLSRLGLLAWDGALARATHAAGSLLIITAVIWSGYLLWCARVGDAAAERA